MAINPSETPRKDTRGLPEGYDPHMFYEYRRETLASNASGIESFAYKYIPWRLLKSFAFAIDPTAPFKVAPHRITPYNRDRQRAVASVLQKRVMRQRISAVTRAQSANWQGHFFCFGPVGSITISSPSDNSFGYSSQDPLIDYSDDTTSRTRLMGSKQGTMRMFKSYINSPTRSLFNSSKTYNHYTPSGSAGSGCLKSGGSDEFYSETIVNRHWEVGPLGALLFPGYHTALKDQEYAYLETLISKHAVSMFKEWSPNKRSSTLFRNIVELRDIPRSIASLQKTLGDLRSLYTSLSRGSLQKIVFDLKQTSKDIPNEYLSYHFGWKQTYKDIQELLRLPETMSKKYEFLIKRAGRPTTFRVKKVFPSALTDTYPTFHYDAIGSEYNSVVKSRLERETELRLVINATFDFPPPNGISFRSHTFVDRIGLVPRPTDLYNLVPWTWLIDWFTGLGSYVECIDNMARDDTLVNWGMITGKTTGKLISDRSAKIDDRVVTTLDGAVQSDITTVRTDIHTSILEYECSIRKDAATALNVKTTAAPDLTGYQQSILGALLAQRKGSFTPKS